MDVVVGGRREGKRFLVVEGGERVGCGHCMSVRALKGDGHLQYQRIDNKNNSLFLQLISTWIIHLIDLV